MELPLYCAVLTSAAGAVLVFPIRGKI